MLNRRAFLTLPLAAPCLALRQESATPEASIAPFQTARVGDIEVAWREQGMGDPLLMIMGFGGTMDAWDPTLLPLLAEHYRVITFDNRGIGSTTGNGPYHFRQLADDVVTLMDALALPVAHIFGWSMGAMIGLDLCLRHGHRVRRAVVHAGDPGGPAAIRADGDAFASLADVTASEEERRQRAIALQIPPEWAAGHEAYLEMVFSRPTAPVSLQAVLLQGQALLERYEITYPLDRIAVPTLILHGTEDRIVPVGNAQLLADAIAGSWLIRLPGGHGVQYQHPREIARFTSTFLESGG